MCPLVTFCTFAGGFLCLFWWCLVSACSTWTVLISDSKAVCDGHRQLGRCFQSRSTVWLDVFASETRTASAVLGRAFCRKMHDVMQVVI